MINNKKSKRLLVILRTSSESTANLSENLIKGQITNNDLLVKCSETPFFKTLERAYEISYENKYPWTLMIDADVLINSKSIEKIITFGQKNNSLVIQGYVLDYLYGGPRSGGLHLYSYEAITKIYTLKPNIKSVIRPETYCKDLICPNGYRFLSVPLILGIHDFFQFDTDYYRKIHFFYIKNKDRIDSLSKFWKEKNYRKIIEIDNLIKNQKQNIFTNKNNICTTDIKIIDSFEIKDQRFILEKIANISQFNIDQICKIWYPEKLYLKDFVSIYIRLLLMPPFAKNQFKLLLKKNKFLIVTWLVLKSLIILLIEKFLIKKFKNFFQL